MRELRVSRSSSDCMDGSGPNVCDLALAGVVRRLSVHEQAGGVFSDGWELELWRTTGRIEDT